jgi:hypothetical protein
MLANKIQIKGSLLLELRDNSNILKKSLNVSNLIVDTGRAFIAQSILRLPDMPSAITHMAIGTSNIAAANSDTSLRNQIGTRATIVSTNITSNSLNDTVSYSAVFLPGNGSGLITEAGLFNASSFGIMLCRTVFTAINKEPNDSLTIIWKITIENFN